VVVVVVKDQCQIRKTVLRQRDINKDKSGGKKVGNVRTMEVLLIYQKMMGDTWHDKREYWILP